MNWKENMLLSSRMMLPGELGNSIRDSGGRIGLYKDKWKTKNSVLIDRDFTGVDFSKVFCDKF